MDAPSKSARYSRQDVLNQESDDAMMFSPSTIQSP